jgi:hypothetical protein
MPRLMSRKRSKVNTDVLDAQSAQLRTRPFGRGLLDAKPAAEDKKRCRIRALIEVSAAWPAAAIARLAAAQAALSRKAASTA